MTSSKRELVKEKYNESAAEYSATHENRFYWIENPKRTISNYLKLNKIDLIVDIGCGSGVMIKSLSVLFPHIKFIGIDISKELIDIAKDNNQNIEFFIADIYVDREKILELLSRYKKNKVLLLSIGTLAYYEKNDDVTKSIISFWNNIDGGIYATFHNNNLLAREFFKKELKVYWNGDEALKVFGGSYQEKTIRYYSFVIIDFIVSKFSIFDRLLLPLDRAISKLPVCLTKKITTNFEILISKRN